MKIGLQAMRAHIIAVVALSAGFSISLTPQVQPVRFDRLTVADGLSNGEVGAICQDRFGFMWFGTSDGLNRYDGRSFKIYRNVPGDSTSLFLNKVGALVLDDDGDLWISAGVLHRYDPETDAFVRHTQGALGELGTIAWVGPGMVKDRSGRLWIGWKRGVVVFDPRDGRLDTLDLGIGNRLPTLFTFAADSSLWIGYIPEMRVVRYDPKERRSTVFESSTVSHDRFPNSQTWGFYSDNAGRLWVFASGFTTIDLSSYRLTHHEAPRPDGTSYSTLGMAEDLDGRIWSGSPRSGIRLYDPATKQLRRFQHDSEDPSSPSSNSVRVVFRDKVGNMWFGTDRGVSKVSRYQKPFVHVRHHSRDTLTILPGEVRWLRSDPRGHIWTVHFGEGLSRYDAQTGLVERFGYRRIFNWLFSLHVDNAGTVTSSGAGHLWSIKSVGGRSVISSRQLFRSNQSDLRNAVYDIHQASDGAVWYATIAGAVRESGPGWAAEWYPTIVDGDSTWMWISHLFEDRQGTMWFENSQGVISTRQKGATTFNPRRGISSFVHAFHEDARGRLWMGRDDGLALYDRDLDSTLYVHRFHHSGSPKVYAVLADGNGVLWCGTAMGLGRFDPETRASRLFGPNDGFPLPSLSDAMRDGYGVAAKLPGGAMAFGVGAEGYVVFDPSAIKENPLAPAVVLTSVIVVKDDEERSRGTFEETRRVVPHEMTLAPDERTFVLSFAALDYTSPRGNAYSYRLESFDRNWSIPTNATSVRYANVPPGRYLFRVKASNSDGVWNEEGASILIVITPPWWRTSWAYGGYVIVVVATILGLRRYELNRQRLKHQAELEHVEAEKLKELDRTKSQFFANISHEFRTPLTLIEGPMSELSRGRFSGDRREVYEMVLRNARRLLRLVNQLLDLSRLDAGQRRLRPQKGDAVEAIRTIAASFESLAARRSIVFEVNAPSGPVRGSYDQEVLEQVLTNLLSNAFKFTPDGGMIVLDIPQSAFRNPKSLQFSVSDSGLGIPQDALDKVFDRFYQVDASQTREQEGSGIGLALTKELVELHGGSIAVSSQEGHGSTFTVTLPIDLSEAVDLREPAVAKRRTADPPPVHDADSLAEDQRPTTDDSGTSSDDRRPMTGPELRRGAEDPPPTVLVIDDNRDMRRYIRRQLEEHYRVIEASNGKEGLEQAKSKTPDLVVSDVMMPKMDGFEVCRRLKNDVTTSHIPVILLTAKAGDGHKLEGLETGADDYLVKPFDARELRVRLKNLYAQRQRMQEAYRRELVVHPTGVKVESMDEQFLKKVFETIESRMADPNLSPAVIARAAAVSRMTLHRKLKAITGMSTGDLIRDLRLQRAHSLLQQKAGTVSEVAYQTGFTNLSHFARLFRAKFGVNPSALRRDPTLLPTG